MELVEERCSQCNFYKCNIHSLSINNFSDNILKCNCSFMDYIWKIKNRNAFKIYVELLMIYMDENDNDYKIDKEIEKLIYSVFNKKDIILINDKEEISNEFKDMNHNIQNKVNNKHNPMESDNSNNKDDEGKKKRIELNYSNINDEKKLFHENDETINGNYLAFRVIKTWLSDNLNNLYGKKLNLILNKLNWYLECFMFGANEISENKLNEFNPLSYDSMNIRINNLLIKFKRKEIKLNKILNEIEIYLNVIKYSEETYSKIIFVLGSFYMHIFYQNYIQSSDSLENRIKYLNIFDYFNSNYLIQLISYNKSWLNTKYNLTTDISITGVKRIKFSNNNNNNNIFNKYLINLKNILNNEDIKNLLNIPIAEKLFLIFNFVVQHQQNDDEKLINNLNGNRRKSNELIQYIVFIYIKIISLMLRQERKDSSIFFFSGIIK
ncbi:hypothetical protein LY90DRAFT_104343 [Neocallimastix californiae]|uniref:Uncharacterized protein n=1 Tax=Neocallimastix californiae TaxID=1754190 RepID=A0A1Y2AUH6_9FUNG|nr:hypothetical protein LY90DRAFT_104343 [Neocallimastix californiae]|eukprot:ORY26202.1 hypothetical protein LY90DRAFT_104343 [Neocallimastix californiae]